MKKQIIDLIKEGKLEKAFDAGEHFLGIMKDHYYSLSLLQSRYQDKKNENIKGVLTQENYTLEVTKINADLLDLVSNIEEDVKSTFHSDSTETRTLTEILQELLINEYEILDVISEGPSTVTYKAKARFEEDLVAIRVLKNDNLFSETEAFDEVNKVKRIQHRNIMTVFGKSSRDVKPKYVLMDYIQGVDINTLVMENGPRPVSETKKMLLKISDALYYLHKRKILNADLRSSRILIDREGEPMISPFIVFRTKSENNYGQIISNLRYMSYQRLDSKDYEHDSPQANQFSLGVIGYLLLTGEMLFDSDAIIGLIESRSKFKKDKDYRTKKLSKIEASEEMKEIVRKLLSPDRKERYPSMLEVINTLKTIGDGLDDYQITARESYSRACSFNPQIMHQLLNKVGSEKVKEEHDLDEIALKFHNIVDLIIETNAHRNYLNKAMESEVYSNLFHKNFDNFKESFLLLLEESDYLWSEDVKHSWERNLNETYEGLNITKSPKKT